MRNLSTTLVLSAVVLFASTPVFAEGNNRPGPLPSANSPSTQNVNTDVNGFPIIDEAAAKKKRLRVLAGITRGWSKSDRAALAPLLTAKDAFLDARACDETVNDGVPGYLAQGYQREADEDSFSKTFRRVAKGKLRLHTSKESSDEDGKLNEVYRFVQTGDEVVWSQGSGDVTKSGVQETERRWIAYRDAWVRFASVKFPDMPRASLIFALTKERVSQLLELAEIRRNEAASPAESKELVDALEVLRATPVHLGAATDAAAASSGAGTAASPAKVLR
ncbi:hypothetical protein F6X40_35405 [Paraburkholderia sp. UCT31]|uniref:lysozyme inhibitor LprI family protein n=1 Tax=Paraburkholderia sp. UCT31 TaxID=2615209 RepID=UPI0016552CB3|nr:lysozyme inhibitor LprI family protein [Paraburkholderia sp. UCT31]MBC8741838.1 hypothetical protein [Paraburkholderia sp. UCT31]